MVIELVDFDTDKVVIKIDNKNTILYPLFAAFGSGDYCTVNSKTYMIINKSVDLDKKVTSIDVSYIGITDNDSCDSETYYDDEDYESDDPGDPHAAPPDNIFL